MILNTHPSTLRINTIIYGRYIIEEVLGQGRYTITYKALDYQTMKHTAVKELYPSPFAKRGTDNSVILLRDDYRQFFTDLKEEFLKNAEILAGFSGRPGFISVYSFFEDPCTGTAYSVMEYVQAVSLARYLENKGGRIPWDKAWEILMPIADALTDIHSKGIVHSDVNPDNIIITDDQEAKLAGFDSAISILDDKCLKTKKMPAPGFAPPEQNVQSKPPKPTIDIYAFAAALYYAITGEAPPDAIERIENDTLNPPSSFGISIPDYAEAGLLKALSVRADDRFRTFEVFKSIFSWFIRASSEKSQNSIQDNSLHDIKILPPFRKPKCISGNYDAEYGEVGPLEKVKYVPEFGKPVFICLWCKNTFVFHYCPDCGHSLKKEMDCPECGFDYKKTPPACRLCYEPTVIKCPQCFQSVFWGEKYCSNCGKKIR